MTDDRLSAIYGLWLLGMILLIFNHPYPAALAWSVCLVLGSLEYMGQCWRDWLVMWRKFKDATRALVVAAFVVGLAVGILLSLISM